LGDIVAVIIKYFCLLFCKF